MAAETGHEHEHEQNDEMGPDDLARMAFGYADGTLDDEAAAEFELHLAVDQSAREALAEAVLMAGSVVRAARAERRGRRRRLASLALACVALIGLPRVFVPPVVAGPDPNDVAMAWSGLRDEGGAEVVAIPAAEEGIDWPAEPLAETCGAPPRWLLEAAALTPEDVGRGS